MEFTIQLDDEDRYNSISFKLGWYRWDTRGTWDHHNRQGFYAVKVPVKGRARWLRRNAPMLLELGFKEVPDGVRQDCLQT